MDDLIKGLLQKVDEKTLAQYENQLKASNLSGSTIKRRLSSLRKFQEWAKKETQPQTILSSKFQPAQPEKKPARYPILKWAFGLTAIIIIILLLTRYGRSPISFIVGKFFGPEKPVARLVAGQKWLINFKGKVTNNNQPIAGEEKVVFKIYNQPSQGESLWESKAWDLKPDANGQVEVTIGDASQGDKEIPSGLFFENEKLWLGIFLENSETPARLPLSTAAHAADALKLGGFPPSQAPEGNMVPVLTPEGYLVLAATSPKIKSTQGTFAIEGEAITIATATASDGNITLAPDGKGVLNLILSAPTGKVISAIDANLGVSGTKEQNTLINGYVGNDNSNYYLLKLESGSIPATRFSVDALGNTTIGGTNLTFSQPTAISLPTSSTALSFGNNLVSLDTSSQRVGINTASPTYTLDVNGTARFTSTIYNLYNKPLKQGNDATITSNGWYRIAQTSGDRASGLFNLLDMTADRQQSVFFYVSATYPNGSNNMQTSVTLLSNARHDQNTFSRLRLLRKGETDPVYVEIYIENVSNNSVRYLLSDNNWDSGWTSLDWENGSVPTGYTSREYLINNINFGINQQSLIVDANGNIGIGTASPTNRLEVAGGNLGITNQGDLRLYENEANGTNFTGFQAPTSLATDIIYSLPTADGTSNQVLATDGSGALSWIDVSGGSGTLWQRILGALSPKNITDDVLTGGTATVSALVKLPGLTNRDAWFNLGTGKVGIGTTSPSFKLTLDNDGGIMAKGTFGSGVSLSESGAGTRMFWYPKKAAFRAGVAGADEWDDANIGNYSTVFGTSSKASNDYTFAAGAYSIASGYHAVSFTYDGAASGNYSFTSGWSAVASAESSFAANNDTTASGFASFAAGDSTTASSYGAFALGRYNADWGTSGSWVATDPIFMVGIGTGAGAKANAMTILKNGSIGIGTTSPAYKLDVTGTLGVSSTAYFASNVGIGTTSPDTKLHLAGGDAYLAPDTGYTFNNPSANEDLYVYGNIEADGTIYGNFVTPTFTPGSVIFAGTGGALTTDTPNFFWNDSSNNLGIGVSSPSSKLSIAGGVGIGTTSPTSVYHSTAIAPDGGLIIEGNVGIGTTGPGYPLEIRTATSKDALSLTYGSAYLTFNNYDSSYSNSASIKANSGGGLALVNANRVTLRNATEAVTLRNEKLGIGNTNPGSLLSLYNNSSPTIQIQNNLSYTGAKMYLDSSINLNITNTVEGLNRNIILTPSNSGYLVLNGTTGVGTSSPSSKLSIAGGVGIGTTSPTSVYHSTAIAPDGGLIIEGNVGIGTTSPSNKLDVIGDVGIDNQGDIRLYEGDVGGSNYTGFQAPATLGNNVLYTLPSADATTANQVLASDTAGGLSWIDVSGGAGTLWQRILGALSPKNITDDVLTGSTATTSALVKLPGLTNRNAWFNLGTGNVGIGATGPTSKLSVAGGVGIGTTSPTSLYHSTAIAPDGGLIVEGRVGIGTTSPGYKLDVSDGTGIVGQFSGRVIGGEAVNTNEFVTLAQLSGGSGSLWLDGGTFLYPNSTFATSVMVPSGSLGVGISSPSSKLSVAGGVGIGTTSPTSVYHSTAIAPDGGLIVEGRVGIGTTGPTVQFEVYDDVKLVSGNSGFVTIGTQDSNNEGAQIAMTGAGSNDTWYFDNLASNLRFFLSSTSNRGIDLYNSGSGYAYLNLTEGYIQAPIFYDTNATYYLDPASTVTSLNVAGIGAFSGTGNNYFAGNVGIGTTAPDSKFHLVGGDAYFAPDTGYTFNNPSANEDLYVYGNIEADGTIYGNFVTPTFTSGSVIFAGTGGALTTDTPNFFWNDSGNYLGIGTSNPSYKLEVNGTLGVGSTAYFASSVGIGISSPAVPLEVVGEARAQKFAFQDDPDTYIDTLSANKMTFATGGTDRMVIDGAYVSIGTTSTSPGATLYVAGDIRVGDGDIVDESGNSILNFNETTLDIGISGGNLFLSDNKYIGIVGAGTEKIYFDATGDDIELMGANVGIGTSSPTSKLSIAGGVGIGTTSSTSVYHSTAIAPDGGLIVEGNVGIGTTGPAYKLDVVGTLGVSSTAYFASNVGIGTTGPTYKLEVNGTLKVGSTAYFASSVGIGTSSPIGSLQVASAAYAEDFVQWDSYFTEEFSRERTGLNTDTALAWGDTTLWSVDEANDGCTWEILDDTINGISRTEAQSSGIGAGRAECLTYPGSTAAGNIHTIFDADNKPIILMKASVDTSVDNTQYWFGISDAVAASNSDPTNGIWFTNDSSGGADWYGQVKTGVNVSTTSSCGTIGLDAYALLMVKVNSATSVDFYIDTDASDGITMTNCGNLTTNIPTATLAGTIMIASGDTISFHSTSVDFYRVWQDDPPIITSSTTRNDQPYDYQTGADIAENYPLIEGKELEPGTLVSAVSGFPSLIQKTSKAYDPAVIGIVSTTPRGDMILGQGGAGTARVALAGRVPVKIVSINGPIKAGDPLTSSPIPGVAMKATRTGSTVGKALEDYDNPDTNTIGEIMAFVNLSWFEPELKLTDAGDLEIIPLESPSHDLQGYGLQATAGELIETVGAFAKAAAAQIQAGLIEAKAIIADQIQVNEKLVSPIVETEVIKLKAGKSDLISPLSNQALEIRNTNDQPIVKFQEDGTTTHFGDLVIQNSELRIKNQEGKTVASMNNQGHLETQSASVSGELAAKRLVVDEIVARKATFGELLTTSESGNLSDVSARIAALENKLGQTNQPTATPTPLPTPEPEASPSADLANLVDQILADAQIENNQPVDFSNNSQIPLTTLNNDLTVLGITSLADTVVSGSLSIDGTLTIADNSINSLNGVLYLNSLGLGGVDFLNGKVTIDKDGNTVFAGDVTVKGSLAANIISPLPDNNLTINLAPTTNSPEESKFGQLLVKGTEGETVASINAQGEASFKKLIIASDQQSVTSDQGSTIETNATAGKAVLPAYETEVTIKSPFVGEDTLVYITPNSATQNKVLFVKAKKAATDTDSGWFTVALDSSLNIDIEFNWWIIN